MSTLLNRFVQSQVRLSLWFDSLLPIRYQLDGNRQYLDAIAPAALRPGLAIWDIGAGKNPVIPVSLKQQLGLSVTGLDIDPNELASAPTGAYDATVCADVTKFRGSAEADLVLSATLLEHVSDNRAAIDAIASTLKPGGRALLFLPSRNAVFARLNILLPESWKRAILFTIFPQTRRNHGFPAYYDRCTPVGFRQLAREAGLEVEDVQAYFRSCYFTFLFPLHLLWRAWILLYHKLAGEQAAETFAITLRKPALRRPSHPELALSGRAQ